MKSKDSQNSLDATLLGMSFKKPVSPLPERMRPTSLGEFIGQSHILSKGKILRRLVESNRLGSCIFYGPPGTGKTSLSSIIARSEGANFVVLNAVSSGTAEAKAVIEKAKEDLNLYGKRTYLMLDECHRWNKAQSDCVLGAIEKGEIIFIGSTTENPFYSMTKAIVSRCRVFEFKPLTEDDIIVALKRAVTDKERGLGEYNITISEDAYQAFARLSGGDVRLALNNLDLAFSTTPATDTGEVVITKEIASECSGGKNLSIDNTTYYDMLSAFCKSLRGTDPDGALYWANRLIMSGVDPQVIARRLIVHSSEDVGLANNNALILAVSALSAYKELGKEEGMIPLTQAIINTALSPKSNSVVVAKGLAEEAVKESSLDEVPAHLKNYNFLNEQREAYKYPHEYGGYVKQQYLPDSVKDKRFYTPSSNGNEKKIQDAFGEINTQNQKTFEELHGTKPKESNTKKEKKN